MYIKIDGNNNIIQLSGEVLGTYEIYENENGVKYPINIQLFENCYEITENMIEEEALNMPYPLLKYDKVIKKIVCKSIEELKLEKYRKLQNEMLNNPNLRELRNAITFQEITKGKGSNPSNAIFTDIQMKNWGDYFGNIAKDNHDLSNLTLEEINPSIFGVMPEIPIAYQNILI